MKTSTEEMTARTTWIYVSLFAGAGAVFMLLGALLTVLAAFGTAPFVAGLALHLLGIAGCLSVIRLRSPRTRLSRSRRQMAVAATNQEPLRGARFHGETQLVRVILGVILVVFLIPCLWLTVHHLSDLFTLRRDGRTCEAQVFNKEREVELGSATTGLVYYSFRVAGRSVTGRFRAARADYGGLRTGSHLKVTYLPDDPRIHRLGIVDTTRVGLECAATLLLMLCGGVYVVGPVVCIEYLLRRELRLARYGVAITGVITGSKPIYRGGRRIGHIVRYEFMVPERGDVRGVARIGQVDGEPTVIGFPITILFDSAWPEHHRPLAAFHRIQFSGMPKSLLAV